MAIDEKKEELDWSTIDWSVRDELVQTFPFYLRERFRLEKITKKLSQAVEIECFTLQTPHKDQTLLKDAELTIEANKRLCLYGGNGTGKTLLFERMADAGIKGFPTHINVYHLKEMEHVENPESVIDTVVHSHKLMGILLKVEEELKKAKESYPEEKQAGVQENLYYIEAQLRAVDAERRVERAQKMLRALGFDEDGQNRSTNDLSGGLRMRVALCCAFFCEPELLLLDEPTNHLDFPSVLWLENRLRGYKGSFLMVTHDRDLLNNVTTGVLLIEELKIKYYKCGFKEFEVRKAKDDKKRDKDTDRFLELNRNSDPSTMLGRQVADKKKWQQDYYERCVRMAGKFTFPEPVTLAEFEGKSGADVPIINLAGCRFAYNGVSNFIFDKPIDFLVTQGTRCGIMGPNGAGKSTLLKLLTKKLIPTEGTCTWHPDFKMAYFGQHSTAELDMELSAMEFMQEQYPDSKSGLLRNHLSKTGVSGGKESIRMKGLSYSQRSCVIFAKLTFVCPHLLIMDEPTNFLDIDSVDSLVSAANKFRGALLVVTHSRGFLRKCAHQYLSVVPGQFLMFDDMDEAERATYTFIQELESGVKMDASELAKGGGSLHSGRQQAVQTKFKVGEKVMGLWTDKKYHLGVVQRIVEGPKTKYAIHYEEFKKTAVIPEAGVKKHTQEPVKTAAEIKKEEAVANQAKQAAAKAAAAKANYAVADKVLCMGSDGKFVEAVIEKVNAFDMFVVKLAHNNESSVVAKKKLRPFDASMLSAPKPQGGGRGGAKGGRGGAKGGRGAAGGRGAGRGRK